MPTVVLYPNIDTMMQSNEPTWTFGSDTQISMGEGYFGDQRMHTLMKADFSSIPAGSTCVSATLTLTYISDNSGSDVYVSMYRCLRNWSEANANWNTYDGSNSWATGGATGALDAEATAVATALQPANPTLYTTLSWSLNATKTQEMWNGTWTNYGWVIREDSGSDNQIVYASSDHGTSGYRPYLTIDYVGGGSKVIVIA